MPSVGLMHGTRTVPVEWREDNGFTFSVELDPGLYTVGLQADMRRFEWERMWQDFTLHGNKGQRTGPWDFDCYNQGAPLIPTWRVRLDGKYLGLFHIQRPTVEDLESKYLRGEFGFRVRERGRVRMECTPHSPFTIDPLVMYLEPNAFDHPERQPWADRGLAANWAHHLAHEVGWEKLRERFLGTEWETFLRVTVEYYTELPQPDRPAGVASPPSPTGSLPVLMFGYRLLGAAAALDKALATIRYWLDQPAWNNPREDGYGHNGDMGCAHIIKYLSLACNWLGEELGELREPLLDRLIRQMEIFFDQQLLMAQYWGGAVVQDHGHRSSPCMGFGILSLLGHTEKAEEWLAFYVPRFYRTLEKLPADGFIPFSSYHKPQLYVNDLTDFRVAYRYASGRDLFAETPAFVRVPGFVLSCLDAESMGLQVCSTRGDRKGFFGGLPFFLCVARDFGCETSGYLAHVLMGSYRRRDFRLAVEYASERLPVWAALETLPMAMLQYDESALRTERPSAPMLQHFPDGGAIQYRNDAQRFNVAVSCFSNTAAFHAVGTDLNGTDEGIANPSAGNFAVAVGRQPLIMSAESGYRTGTRLGNVLLIDGKGQHGDMGYTMGVPIARWRGQRIQRCHADQDGETGFARLRLAPAYPDGMGVLTYTRDFYFEPTRLLVRDTVITREDHLFSYWFNTHKRHDVELLPDNVCRIARGELAVRMTVVGDGWTCATGDTDVVWAYNNENEDQDFMHIEVATTEPQRAFTVDFVVELVT